MGGLQAYQPGGSRGGRAQRLSRSQFDPAIKSGIAEALAHICRSALVDVSLRIGQSARVPMSNWAAIEDLIWLFEVEPQIEHDDVGYPVSATTFTTTRGSTLVECTIEPYMNSVTLSCVEQGEQRVLLHLWAVVDEVAVDRGPGRETLVVSMVPELPFRKLRLELKPSVRLTWESVAPWAPGTT
jgi:hypothetical protein